MSTRERKIRFMAEGGRRVLREAMEEMFIRHGADWLTDEQIDDCLRHHVAECRFREKLNRENRERARQHRLTMGTPPALTSDDTPPEAA